jgi:hypothetical protein
MIENKKGDIMYIELKEKKTQNITEYTDRQDMVFQKTTGTRTFDMFKNFENLGGSVNKSKIQKALIKKYREYFEFPKVFEAVMDIVNSLVPIKDGDVVDLILDKLEDIKELDPQILKSAKNNLPYLFESVKRKMIFDRYGNQYALDWYVDSGLWVKVETDPKKKLGITEIEMLDPLRLELVEENNEYKYLYIREDIDGTPNEEEIEEIPYDKVLFIGSGLRDANTGINIGYLNKAIRPINHLNMMENSMVVHRFVRAPERWVFKIDVSGMNSKRAKAYIKQMQEKYRSRYTIDAITGELKSQSNVMAMQENFWIAKTESQNGGHEIDTIGGNASFGDIDDILYAQKEVYKSLHVPLSRLEPDSTFNFGSRVEEISRDEMKFQAFIKRLRMFFNNLFLALLKVECIYTKTMKEDEFNEIINDLIFRYENDSVYEMARKRAEMETMFELASQYEEIALKYKGEDWFRKEILRETDDEIIEFKEIVKKEKEEREKEYGDDEDDESSNTTFVKHKKSTSPEDLIAPKSKEKEKEE